MENTHFAQRLAFHRAKSELTGKLQTMGLIALCWFILLRICLLGSDDVTNLELLRDAVTASTAMYLPYRVGFALTGTPAGGAIGAIVILLWMSTWVADHELLAWVVIVGGYLADFGPCIYRMLTSRSP